MSTLLTVKSVDQWRRFNPHIVSGYRPRMSTRAALRSFFEWHNESISLWSHTLAALFVLYLAFFPPALGYINIDSTLLPRHERRWSALKKSGGSSSNNYNSNNNGKRFFFCAGSAMVFRITCLLFFFAFICSVVCHLFVPCTTSKSSYQRLMNCGLFFMLTFITAAAWSFLYCGNACNNTDDGNLTSHAGTIALLLAYLMVLYSLLFSAPHGSSTSCVKVVGFYLVFRFFILLWMEQPKVQLQGYHQALHYHVMSYLFILIGGAINLLRFPEKQLFYLLRPSLLSGVQVKCKSRCFQWISRYLVRGEDIDFMWNSRNFWHYCLMLSATMAVLGCYYDMEEFELARCRVA